MVGRKYLLPVHELTFRKEAPPQERMKPLRRQHPAASMGENSFFPVVPVVIFQVLSDKAKQRIPKTKP
jgi:hypothetical protein